MNVHSNFISLTSCIFSQFASDFLQLIWLIFHIRLHKHVIYPGTSVKKPFHGYTIIQLLRCSKVLLIRTGYINLYFGIVAIQNLQYNNVYMWIT